MSMNKEELLNYRDTDGYIDYDRFESEKGKNLKTIDEDRGSSSRNKKWVFFDNGTVMLRDDQFEDDGTKFTTYQELIFEELAKQVNFPVAHYDLIKRGDKRGIITYNVLDNEDNKEMTMYSLRDFMDQIDCKDDNKFNYNIADAYSAIKNFSKESGIEKEQYAKVMVDFTKMQVLDLFLSSTDRHAENISFLYGVDKVSKKPIIKLAPLYDNELSCGSDLTEEEMIMCSEDFREAKQKAALQQTCATVPYEYAIKDRNSTPNSQLLKFCMEIDDEVEDFVGDCLEKINIIDAVNKVQDRINTKLPYNYVDYLLANFSEKKKEMNKIVNDFYQVI